MWGPMDQALSPQVFCKALEENTFMVKNLPYIFMILLIPLISSRVQTKDKHRENKNPPTKNL